MMEGNDDLTTGLHKHPGVLVDGKPLEMVVKEVEAKELRSELSRELADQMMFYRRSGRRRYVRPQMKGRARSSRTRVMSDREIRKEYGIMEKKFKTNVENILWVIQEMGPLTAREISDMLGIKSSSVSSVVSKAVSHLPEYVGREESPQGLQYRALSSYSVESVHRKYKERSRAEFKKKIIEEIEERPPGSGSTAWVGRDIEFREELKPGSSSASSASSPYVELKEREDSVVIVPPRFRVELRVSGTIKVLFGWVRE